MKHAIAKKHSSGFRRQWIGIVVFIVSAVLFGVILLHPYERSEQSPAETVGDYRIPRTLLVFLHDGGGKLTAAVVLHVDDGITVTGYPKQTEVVYDTALRPLSSCYEKEGIDTAKYLRTITGGDCDAVLRLSLEALASFADRLGNGVVLDGELVTGYRMAELLRSEGKTVTDQAKIAARCVAAIVDRYLIPNQNFEQAFHLLSVLCDDRLIMAQFLAAKAEIVQLAEMNDGALCTVSVPEGTVVGVGDEQRFSLQNKAE